MVRSRGPESTVSLPREETSVGGGDTKGGGAGLVRRLRLGPFWDSTDKGGKEGGVGAKPKIRKIFATLLNSASALGRAFWGLPGALRRLMRMQTQHTEAAVPAAPRCGGRWGLHVLCFYMYEAPPGAPGRHQKARFKTEALLSNVADFKPFCHAGATVHTQRRKVRANQSKMPDVRHCAAAQRCGTVPLLALPTVLIVALPSGCAAARHRWAIMQCRTKAQSHSAAAGHGATVPHCGAQRYRGTVPQYRTAARRHKAAMRHDARPQHVRPSSAT
jgi:hypothetical protein